MHQVLLCLTNLLCLLAVTYAYECASFGTMTVFYDGSCSKVADIGCNAGGQGQNGRFCGFAPNLVPCPSGSQTTTDMATTSPKTSPVISTQTPSTIQAQTKPYPTRLVQGAKHGEFVVRMPKNQALKHSRLIA
jgi:hypothetical protein